MRTNHFRACLDCGNRAPGCSAACPVYKAAKEAYDREKSAINAERYRESNVRGFKADSVRYLKKRKGLKR